MFRLQPIGDYGLRAITHLPKAAPRPQRKRRTLLSVHRVKKVDHSSTKQSELRDSHYSPVRAGAIYLFVDSTVSIGGEATFTNNTAAEDGGE